jgi:uncharacterized phage protein (TIGR02218 family)
VAYLTAEKSLQSGTPIELYEFMQDGVRWTFASCAYDVIRLGQTYKASSVGRSALRQTTDPFKGSMTFTFPRLSEFAMEFLGVTPESPTIITIYRGHAGDVDSEFITYWKGRVMSAKAADSKIELACESIFTSMRRIGLRAKFETSCRRTLYGIGCNVNRELYRLDGTISTVTGTVLTIDGLTTGPLSGWFTGGLVYASDGTSRFIIAHDRTAGTITIARPLFGLRVTTVARMYPGCNHLRGTCDSKFSNILNFGGFPWIPTRNPLGGSSIT